MTAPVTIGLLGGMSWESTALYYSKLNQAFNRRLGGVHSAPVLIDSLEFHQIRQLQLAEDWDTAGRLLAEHARRLEDAGAGLIAMAVNTMHRVADAVENAVNVPFIDIRACAVSELERRGLKKPLLLGGSIVLQEDGFYVRYMRQMGIDVALPISEERSKLDQIIFEQFPRQIFSNEARDYCLSIIDRSKRSHDIDSVVLACTELPILFAPMLETVSDTNKATFLKNTIPLTVVDTVVSHVNELVTLSNRA